MGMNIIGYNMSIVLEDGESSIFSLLNLLQMNCPVLLKLYDQFYEDIRLFPDEIMILHDELVQLREKYCSYLLKKKRVNTNDQSALNYIRLQVCAKDLKYKNISEFIDVCRQAIDEQSHISFFGD
jgi:hypothetical protein